MILAPVRTAAAAFVTLILASCSHEREIDSCGRQALNVHRTLQITHDSPPAEQLLRPGEVILSFDDGPHPTRTVPVLRELERHCTRASFFLLGEASSVHPQVVREIAARGHTLGGHSWNHTDLVTLTLDAAVEDAVSSNRMVGEVAGTPTVLFRFPFISTHPQLSAAVSEAGLIDVTVTVDGQDWTPISPRESVEKIMAGLERKGRLGIVLLHDPYPASGERTRILLDTLKERGYKIVALEGPSG